MEKALRRARRETGIARFERSCRLTQEGRWWKKAWRVPGTREAGRHAMLQAETWRRAKRYRKAAGGDQ